MIRSASVTTPELRSGELRLDAFYYAGGGRAARQWLECAGLTLQRLDEVAEPPFMGLRFARHYVDDPRYGVSFLGPSEMQLAELTGLPLVSRVRTTQIDQLRIREGWMLISRSGAIGNFAYVRQDMDGLVGSDDLIRIVPRPGGAPLGYLFTYLTSDIGTALLRRSTYGAVIQHIEPHHLADLLVPRLGEDTESTIHDHIVKAAEKRVAANEKLRLASRLVHEVAGLPNEFTAPRDHAFACGHAFTSELRGGPQRLDAYYYIGHAGEVRSWVSPNCVMMPLGDAAERIFNPPIFKRIRSDEGLPYFLGAEVYQAHPRTSSRIAHWTPNLKEYVLQRDMVVFEDAGQRYGLLGTPAYVGRTAAGCAATNNMTRIVSRSTEDAGYLFALLSSDFGRRLIVRQSYGTSLPHILPKQVAEVPIPWPEEDQRRLVAAPVQEAISLRDDANDLEDNAQTLLHRALETATGIPWPSFSGPEVGKIGDDN